MDTTLLLIIILVLIALLLTAVLVLRTILHAKAKMRTSHVVFAITIPKYADEGKSEMQKKTAERLAQVENIFSVLASTKAQRGLKSWLYGRDDHFSLEIVSTRGLISFYAALPPEFTELFTEQLHAVYPNAQMQQIPDYNMFQPQATILTGHLVFRKSYIFPLKTYRNMEADPLEGVLSALSNRTTRDGGAAIQFIFRSSKSSWHAVGRKVVESVYKGTRLKDAVRQYAKTRSALGTVGKVFGGIFSIFGASFSSSKPKELPQQQPQHQLSAKDQESLKGVEEKISKAGFDANIRIVVSMPDRVSAEAQMRTIMDAFGQFNIYEYGNALRPQFSRNHESNIKAFIYRTFDEHTKLLLNSEEATSLFHLPELIHAPNIQWLQAKKVPPPSNLPQEGILLGYNSYRGSQTPIHIKDNDRRRHMYVIGQTGVGKSEFLNRMAIQDIQRGKGVCVIDPHGDLVETILSNVPRERINDVIVFDPSDTDRPMALNMLEYDTPDQKTFVINEMINIFEKLYDLKQTGGPMFEQYMRNAMLLIMEDPESGSTLLEIPKVLADTDFRKHKLSKTQNPVVRDFWEKEAQKAGGDASLANMVPYITSKLTQFVSNDTMRPIISQQKSSFNFREVMDSQKILLINLSKGKIGEMNSSLLGLISVGRLLMAALGRVNMPEDQRKDFYLYIDEFQNYVSPSIAIILSEARKYRLNLTMAHQYINQLVKAGDTSVRDAVFGNVGTMVAFRIGTDDAEVISEQFAPTVSPYDLVNIEKYNAYIRLLVDNQNPPAFSFAPEPPVKGDVSLPQAIKEHSRMTYGKPRAEVEKKFFQQITSQPTQKTPQKNLPQQE